VSEYPFATIPRCYGPVRNEAWLPELYARRGEDYALAKAFYARALAPLGYTLIMEKTARYIQTKGECYEKIHGLVYGFGS
jgi:hypothetical protein